MVKNGKLEGDTSGVVSRKSYKSLGFFGWEIIQRAWYELLRLFLWWN
jgi:hypothetical protein